MREHLACHAVIGVNSIEMVHLKGLLTAAGPRKTKSEHKVPFVCKLLYPLD